MTQQNAPPESGNNVQECQREGFPNNVGNQWQMYQYMHGLNIAQTTVQQPNYYFAQQLYHPTATGSIQSGQPYTNPMHYYPQYHNSYNPAYGMLSYAQGVPAMPTNYQPEVISTPPTVEAPKKISFKPISKTKKLQKAPKPLLENDSSPQEVENSGLQKEVEQWPPSLRNYAIRIFDLCPAQHASAVEKRIKDIIIQAINNKMIWTIDWNSMPLPEVCQEELKLRNAMKENSSEAKDGSQKKTHKRYEISERTSSNVSSFSGKMEQDQGYTLAESISDYLDGPHLSKEILAREERKKRFKIDSTQSVEKTMKEYISSEICSVKSIGEKSSDLNLDDNYSIFGTCQTLEKSYLRLTSAPNASTVRPLEVLEKAYELVMNKWNEEHNYTYICDQFKSIRQDITVQHIKNEFTVKIYESHARIALEVGDLGEFNQCLGQILQMCEVDKIRGSPEEFTAYRILYLILTKNKIEIVKTIEKLTEAQKKNHFISHALSVRSAISVQHFYSFFRLYYLSPGMSKYLIAQMLDRERTEAVRQICKAYRPTVPLSFLARHLGFVDPKYIDKNSKALIKLGESMCSNWLKSKNACLVYRNENSTLLEDTLFDTKQSLPTFVQHCSDIRKKGVDIKGQMH